jgi:biotin transport system substrate-specific component
MQAQVRNVAGAESRTLLAHASAHASLGRAIRVAACAFAVALTAAAAQVTAPLPFTAVPLVLTPLAVMLTGAALGSRLGFLTQTAYLMAGAAGLQVFAPSVTLPPGALRLLGPTGGYLMAYPLAAFATGWLAERGWDRRYVTAAAAMLVGLTIIFVGGVAWLRAAGFAPSWTVAVATGFLPHIGFDLVKVLAAAAILPQAWRIAGRGQT